jgi:arsenate reductase
MAEAIVNQALGERWTAFSAGSRPAGFVHPLALQALAEIGIEHHGTSKGVEQFQGQAFDLVITLCDDADRDCPVWLGQGRKLHIGFPDPAEAVGSPEQVLAVFRKVRDDMRAILIPVLNKE